MPLFQQAVVKKYLNAQNTKNVSDQWNVYQAHFLNPTIQENIRNSKEEQYQGEFLIDLFVNVLGYTKNPTPNFNLTTELKNEKDSKKADGGIIVNDTVIGVIELKGTNTTDLGKIEVQAFGYKNNQRDCVYVITSNFEKLRFYIDNAIENIEFNLFQLTEKEFALLYLCLGFENISKNIPKKIKEESVNQENQITKELYKDYSVFKNNLFHNLTALNPEYEPLELFKKSQKLIDRFLFLFFAEDRQLLPPNSVRLILDDWKDLQERDVEIPLYDRYKKYFEYLNTGYKGKRYDVFAYNGGLFKPDTILDTVKIDDTILYNHTLKLATYDFASEVDVNILGHIFENSLNELDEMKAQLEGTEIDKTKTKRKKDGVFYTPKYITKYIVANTVGTLCEEQKIALQLDETEYNTDKKRTKATKQPLLEKLTKYRDWLLQITIIDPACGSGAFLNEALNFLIAEHSFIDELQAKLFGDAMVLSDVEKSILENNLFGVDLNEESVEIAKLSLWLRTAQPNRKLNDLNNNIKCGNSLIDDESIAGDKAFVWEKEFPQIFAKGGFDVVIGNPPYVLMQPSNTDEKTLDYFKTFEVASYKIDLFHLFFEKSINILKQKGKLGFITPNTYLNNKYIKPLRSFILNKSFIEEIVNYEDPVFVDAGVDVATLVLTKTTEIKNAEIKILKSNKGVVELVCRKSQNEWNKEDDKTFNMNLELNLNFDFTDCKNIEDFCTVTFGLQTKDKSTYVSDIKKEEDWEPCYTGKDIMRYLLNDSTLFFKNNFKEVKAGGSWNMDIHHSKKIVVRQVGNPEPIFAFDSIGYATLNTMYSIVIVEQICEYQFLLSVLNSKLIKKYFLSKYADGKQLFPKIKGFQIKALPIKIADKLTQQSFIEKADLILSLNKELQLESQKFQRTIQRKFELEDLPKKLQDWYNLRYSEFIKELAKKKIKLSLSDEAEWEDYFTQESKKALDLKAQIDTTDKAIDAMVYELYGLSKEEIEIVGNS